MKLNWNLRWLKQKVKDYENELAAEGRTLDKNEYFIREKDVELALQLSLEGQSVSDILNSGKLKCKFWTENSLYKSLGKKTNENIGAREKFLRVVHFYKLKNENMTWGKIMEKVPKQNIWKNKNSLKQSYKR
jgi:hypothetical protein